MLSSNLYEYMNESAIDANLKCTLCLKPYVDPVTTNDADRYCRECITRELARTGNESGDQLSSYDRTVTPITEPLVFQMLDALLVKCTKCGKTNIERGKLQEHDRSMCPQRIVACTAAGIRCPWMGPQLQLDNHSNHCVFELLRPVLTEILVGHTPLQEQSTQLMVSLTEHQQEMQEVREQIQNQIDVNSDMQSKIQQLKEREDQMIIVHDEYRNHIHRLEAMINRLTTRNEELQSEVVQYKEQCNQQTTQCSTFQKEVQQLREWCTQQNNRNDGLQSEIRLLMERDKQQTIQNDRFQKDIQQLRERWNQLGTRYDEFQNLIRPLKEQNKHQIILSDLFQSEVQQLKEQGTKQQTAINELQTEDQSRGNEIIRVQKQFNQQMVQIKLLARKHFSTPALSSYRNPRLEDMISQCQTGGEIDLDGQQLTDQDMKIVAKQAIIDKQCTVLWLGNNQISSIGAAILADALQSNRKLEKLYLDNNQLSDAGVHFLAEALSINHLTLKWLELQSNGITDDGAQSLATMLRTNRILGLLGLGYNEIGNRGVELLANTLAHHNTSLEWLYLSSNRLIGDSSVDYLIEMLKRNRSLKTLWLGNCKLSETGKVRLQEVAQSNRHFILEM